MDVLRMDCPRGHRRRRADGLDGLSCLRKICKAHLFVNWACMINADLMAIGHVSGSHQIGRVLHEVIIFTMLMT